MSIKTYAPSCWAKRAIYWLDKARNDAEMGRDPIPATEAALACMRIDAGEHPPDWELITDVYHAPAP